MPSLVHIEQDTQVGITVINYHELPDVVSGIFPGVAYIHVMKYFSKLIYLFVLR